MRLKLRHNKNKRGEKVWAIYRVSGKVEALHKKIGIAPKELAEQIFKKEMVSNLCLTEGIRRNVDISFDQVCDEYLEMKCRPPHKTENTYRGNVGSIRQVKRTVEKVFARLQSNRLRAVMIHEVTLSSLDSYKVTRKEDGVSNRTINIELNLIRKILEYALEKNYMIRFNLRGLKNLPEEQPKRAWLEDISDVDRLVNANVSPATRLKIKIGFEAGLRSGEILSLKLENIDLQGRLFRVYGSKENRFKEVPMSEEMSSMLVPMMTHRYDRKGEKLHVREAHQKEYLFCDKDGKPFGSFKKAFSRAKERAGVTQKFSPHSMRHTFASHLIKEGASYVAVSRMLGHSKVSTTMNIYAHSSKEDQLKSFEKLPYLKRPMGDVIPMRMVANAGKNRKVGSNFSVGDWSSPANCLNYNVGPAGFEPATLCLEGISSIFSTSNQVIENKLENGGLALC